MKRFLLCLACAVLLTGCWAQALSFVVFTVIPSIEAGAEMRAARETVASSTYPGAAALSLGTIAPTAAEEAAGTGPFGMGPFGQ